MPRSVLPIAAGSYRLDSLPVSAQDCINLYPVVDDGPALAQETLDSTPGIEETVTVWREWVVPEGEVDAVLTEVTPSGECRGSHLLGEIAYFVFGDKLYALSESGGSMTQRKGPAISGTGPVTMAQNGKELFICTKGGDGYVYDDVNDLQEVTDSDFTANGTPAAVVFLDGYFVFTTNTSGSAGNKVIISNLNQGLVFDAIDFGSVESSPDDVVAPVVFRNQLYVGGATTTEAFSNVGGLGFPFQRINVFFDQGFVSRYAAQVALNQLLFLGAGENQQLAVWASSGNDTQKISTRAIDQLIQEELSFVSPQLNLTTSWSYAQNGHYFVGWNLTNTSIVYDLTTGRWHERRSRVETNPGEFDIKPWRGAYPLAAYGEIWVGDTQGPRVGKLSSSEYEEFGFPIVREFTTMPFQNNMEPFFVPWMELTVESGMGSLTRDPVVVMSRSTDGGKTFKYQRQRPIGKQGEYDRRAIWRRNGRVDRFDCYRFTFSEPYKYRVAQLTADIEAGDG